jgi:hypothetical protein
MRHFKGHLRAGASVTPGSTQTRTRPPVSRATRPVTLAQQVTSSPVLAAIAMLNSSTRRLAAVSVRQTSTPTPTPQTAHLPAATRAALCEQTRQPATV